MDVAVAEVQSEANTRAAHLIAEHVNDSLLELVATAQPQSSGKAVDNVDEEDMNAVAFASASQPLRRNPSNFFSSLEWSSDGTTILLSSNANRQLDTYILPSDLLEKRHNVLPAYRSHPLPSFVYASVIHPQFSLSSPASCLYLGAVRSLPIRLLSPFTSNILASYPLYYDDRELWLTPHSLLFHPRDGRIFYAGGENGVCVFDMNRDGEGPYAQTFEARWKRKKLLRHGVPMGHQEEGLGQRGLSRGLVSALAMNMEGCLAAGTFTGEVGITNTNSEEGTVVKLALPADAGAGVTGLKFHPDPSRQNYLVTASRKADALHVFDVRNPGSSLASLENRKAMTPQRMGFDVTDEGEVWAGGTDGSIRVWEEVGLREGAIAPRRTINAHGDTVSGVGWHPGGAGVLATCAGSRKHVDLESDDVEVCEPLETGASMKLWNLSQPKSANGTSI